MTDLEALIEYWHMVLDFGWSRLSPSQTVRIEDTIGFLEKLKVLEGE